MRYGLARHAAELARFRKRLSLALGVASAVFLIPFLALWSSPELRRSMTVRFGFEGPEQYVRRIQLSSLGDPRGGRERTQLVEPTTLPEQKRGGGSDAVPSPRPGVPVQVSEPFKPPGLGDSEEDILARAMLRAGDTPLFQSRELVIERLVEPEYPHEARERGIEGRVAVLALVDRAGSVREAEIVGTAGDALLERASLDAVMQCRFRPYMVEGEPREVYAMFRFAFRLLN
jgi:TonB family protein